MEDIPIYQSKRKNILVVSGGGLKGFSALGALTRLKELEIIDKPEIYCGTSIGAIIILLLAIGYSSQDIFDVISSLDFTTLITNNIENILNDVHIGINSPDPIIYVIGHLMKEKKINIKITFEQLYKKLGTKIIITGVCVNDTTLHYFSNDTTPSMQVLKAIRISISVPIIFTPCLHEDKIWIDGGIMNNYPIDLFHDKLNDVIGIYLDEEYNTCDVFEDAQTYIYQIIKCFLRGFNYNKIEFYKKNTIHIKCKNYLLGSDITKEEINILYKIGYDLVTNIYE